MFQLSCSENFINSIVGTTKDYRSSVDEDANTITSRNTSLLEIYCFLAMKLLMPRNKKLSYREYWPNDELLKSKIFGELISRDRFLYLTIFLTHRAQFWHGDSFGGSASPEKPPVAKRLNMITDNLLTMNNMVFQQ